MCRPIKMTWQQFILNFGLDKRVADPCGPEKIDLELTQNRSGGKEFSTIMILDPFSRARKGSQRLNEVEKRISI